MQTDVFVVTVFVFLEIGEFATVMFVFAVFSFCLRAVVSIVPASEETRRTIHSPHS